MFNSNRSKAVLTIGFIGTIFFAYDSFAQKTVEDLDSNKKLVSSGLSEDWKSGNIILLVRHEERCDRSSNPCLGPDDGITSLGSERAKETGNRLKSNFTLDNTDILTSPAIRTVQTSDFMFGKANPLANSKTICGSDIVDDLLKHKTTNRNLIVVTHSSCINDLIDTGHYRTSEDPEYGSLLFSKISDHNKIRIVGKSDPEERPEQPVL
ncbi:histidine phosphatase family protein [Pseudomonas sp. M30-35]|uniref:lipopolysaccharide core heptose(II)-phosphate phosphatase PmrG n=1 Tax=Pseudomonas sp. M30-35 TaxID=1981174 RepID=UPI000B3CF702|nr:histidine phosphatase family protein [Pseudomonas sp. M30-35]ARU87167.1 histidine phosphatase family protein [Pseudomonas sp. M30-35]